MSVFVKVRIIDEFELAQVREVYPLCVFFRHLRQVVEPPRAQRPGAKRNAVVLVRHGGEQPVEVRTLADDARQSEYIPRRIVGVYSHIDTALVARGHYPVKEVYEVVEQLFVRHAFVRVKQSVELVGGIALVPARQARLAHIELFELRLAVTERRASVVVLVVEIGPEPIEHGHEVIANALYARPAERADILRVILDISVARRSSELDILMNGHRLDDFHT